MITETINNQKMRGIPLVQHRVLRIVKQAQNHLVLFDGKSQMMFKRYQMKRQGWQILNKRFHLKHQSLIKLHKIERQYVSQQPSEDNILCCGILFQKYSKTLQQSLKEMKRFNHQEIVQTFYPIKQVVDYLVGQNYDPGHIDSSSIVCTDDYEIKFIDSYLSRQSFDHQTRNDFATRLYQELANLIFELLFPRQKHIKAWRCRYQIAEKQLPQPIFRFYQEIYKKFGTYVGKEEKSKGIAKDRKKKDKNTKGKTTFKHIDSQTLKTKTQNQLALHFQCGKQNKIIQ